MCFRNQIYYQNRKILNFAKSSSLNQLKWIDADYTTKFRWHAEIWMARRNLDGTPKFGWHAKIWMARRNLDGTQKFQWHAGTLTRKHAMARWHVGTPRHAKARGHAGTLARQGTLARWHA